MERIKICAIQIRTMRKNCFQKEISVSWFITVFLLKNYISQNIKTNASSRHHGVMHTGLARRTGHSYISDINLISERIKFDKFE
jgi:hypothetical protein